MNFQRAMALLREGHRVRRPSWPKESVEAGTHIPGGDGGPDYVVPKAYARSWHLFNTEYGIINGWGGSVGGGDATDHNGMGYMPTAEDRAADDWVIVLNGEAS